MLQHHVSTITTDTTAYSPTLFTPFKPKPQASLVFALPGSAEYESFSQHIAEVFEKTYGAKVNVTYPLLMGFMDADETPLAALGIRRAISNVPLFLEHYLDRPAHEHLSMLNEKPVLRHDMVEVGNLASTGRNDILRLLYSLACHLEQEGIGQILFTGTTLLKRYINSLGLYPHVLADARAERLGHDAALWGSYYSTNPQVLAGSVTRFRAGLEAYATRAGKLLTGAHQ